MMDDDNECGETGGKFDRKPKYLEETCPIVALSTTNPTLSDPDSNPGHSGGNPAPCLEFYITNYRLTD
jgi:hypothetical protein